MAVGELFRPDVRLAEDVAALSVLKALPGETLSNPFPPHAYELDPNRKLSFTRELFLSSGLAFLAEISDDPNYVVAVATQERPDRQGLAVVVAINKANPMSAEGTLKKIKRGLQDIFDVLAKVGHDGHTRLVSEVLDAIIRLCGTRILKRLSSTRVRPTNALRVRSYFGKALNKVRNALRMWSAQTDFQNQHRSDVGLFLDSSENLALLLEELKDCPERRVDRKLEDIISTARRIKKHRHLPAILRDMPNRYLGPTDREDFLTRLGELARYLELSQHLCQTAKNVSLFKNVEVVDVRLDENYFARGTCPRRFSTFNECLARCVHGNRDAKKLCQNQGMTVSEATDQLRTTAQKGMTESKIHAEIQVAAYYETNPAELPPRIICSNKDACYLCDKFLKLQGKYYIPKCHGKLYPRWRVPSLRIFDDILAKLIEALESKIDSRHQEVVHRGATRLPGPSNWTERANVLFSDSMSTLPSLPSRESLGESDDDTTDAPTSATQGFQPSLPTIAEGPAHLPTLDDLSDSDASTVRPDDDSGEAGDLALDDERVPDPSTETTTRDSVDRELRDTGDEPGPIIVGKGKQKAAPEGEDLGLPEDEPDSGKAHASGDVEDKIEAVHGMVEGSSSTETGPSLATSPGGEQTEDTSPEEQRPTEAELRDRREGKRKAESKSDSEYEHQPNDFALPTATPIMLSKGVVLVCQLNSDRPVPCYQAGHLTIIPEFVRAGRSGEGAGICDLHVEWLTDEEASNPERSGEKVTDVQIMEEDVDIDSGSPKLFTLLNGHTVIRMTVNRS